MRTVVAVVAALVLAAPTPHALLSSSVGEMDHHLDTKLHQSAVSSAAPHIMPAGEIPSPHILFGEEAAECQFPHQVALQINSYSYCGGSLLGAKWVLTAAHCIADATSVAVFMGSTEWRSAPVQRGVRRIFLHGDFNAQSLNYDIALLELSQEVAFTDCLQPVELETTGCGDSSLVGVDAVVSGWGKTSQSSQTAFESKLRWVRTRPISNEDCAASYNNEVVIDSTLCSLPLEAGNNGTLCHGDSGGPLLLESSGRLIGINSFVSSDGCDRSLPSGYLRVGCFVDWVNYVMQL